MITQDTAYALIEKQFSATLTEAEKADLDEWLLADANRNAYIDKASDLMMSTGEYQLYDAAYWQPVLNRVLETDRTAATVHPLPQRKRTLLPWMAAAAVLLVMLAGVFYLVQKPQQAKTLAEAKIKDVAPGHTGAVLTLADGRVVQLDSLADGVVASDNGAEIRMNAQGLVYNNKGVTANAYNTVSTPVGRQFMLTLPDGSRVWLNSTSSLRYPVAFTGNERRVEVSGEAYFEVTANAAKPFKVQTERYGVLEVLGTAFNINAYADEKSGATTLVSGAVRVNTGSTQLVLQPGQQAQVSVTQAIHLNAHPNLEQVTAWKDGVFNFDDQPLEVVMRQLARWYNIEIVYQGRVPNIELFGAMGKNLNLLQVLHVLDDAGVKFKMEETNKLVIMP
jgi:ferric-dicitrate binding protein FerR (iron transport regulator)